MAPSPRRVDLRLTITAAAPYHAVAGELAGKFAEYSGAAAGPAEQLAKAVESLAETLGAGASDGSIALTTPDPSIVLTMQAREGQLVVVAQSGTRTEQATCPLPA